MTRACLYIQHFTIQKNKRKKEIKINRKKMMHKKMKIRMAVPNKKVNI